MRKKSLLDINYGCFRFSDFALKRQLGEFGNRNRYNRSENRYSNYHFSKCKSIFIFQNI